jgi:hypothetical protein
LSAGERSTMASSSSPPGSHDEGEAQPEALAVRGGSGLDPYERKYMSGQGAVLHRAKRPAPAWLQLITGSTALAGVAMLFSSAWLSGLVFVPLGIVLWALLSVLRVTVSEGAVNVQYGPFGPTIPTASIDRAEAVSYHWAKFGGWGIRRSLDGEWMYNMPGDGGRALRIEWRDAKGKRVVTNIGLPEPEAAVRAIAQARRALQQAPVAGELTAAGDDEP